MKANLPSDFFCFKISPKQKKRYLCTLNTDTGVDMDLTAGRNDV